MSRGSSRLEAGWATVRRAPCHELRRGHSRAGVAVSNARDVVTSNAAGHSRASAAGRGSADGSCEREGVWRNVCTRDSGLRERLRSEG